MYQYVYRSVLVVLISILFLSSGAWAAAPIQVDNFTNGETLRYSVPLLRGTLADASLDKIVVTNLSSKRDTRELTGMAEDGKFKALVELVPGTNHLQLSAGGKTSNFELVFKPQTNPRFIRAVLFTDQTGDTKYETPIPDDKQDYRGKFDTILKIMQGYTADWMNQYGYGRKTYNLELDADGKVIVHIVKGSKAADYYRYQLDRNQLYDEITEETIKSLPDAPCVDCTLISFSCMDPKLGHSVAYTALGGGKVALFGGACMYSFPDSLADVQKAFTNATEIDSKKYVSDSIERFTFWATASTSIGAMLHEMGHSMGLPHSNDPRDIMTRGIDNFGRYFVFYDPPSKRNPQAVHFTDDQVGYWSPVSAAALAPATWLDLDKRTAAPPKEPGKNTVELSSDGAQFTITNPRGLAFVGYEVPGVAHSFHKIDTNAPLATTLHLSAKEVFTAVGKGQAQFRIIDGDGHMSAVDLGDFGWAFVRRWHISPVSEPWSDTAKFPVLSDIQLHSIFDSAMKQPVTVARSGSVGLSTQEPSSASYAAMTIQSPDEQAIKILTGSHDGIRVWLNGKLVTQALAIRPAVADAESSDATLKKGKNDVLVEVTHGQNRGQFLFRMTAEDGSTLKVADDGSLTKAKAPELLGEKK